MDFFKIYSALFITDTGGFMSTSKTFFSFIDVRYLESIDLKGYRRIRETFSLEIKKSKHGKISKTIKYFEKHIKATPFLVRFPTI